jgi:hypothetical protein
MLLWILVLLGILVWPELTLCVLLFFYGHPILAVVAFIASFYNGKEFVWDKIKDKTKT